MNNVKIEIIGVKEAIKKIDMKNREIREKVSAAINREALKVEGEVKQSIAGRRSEPRSVDTGKFMQSVTTIPGILEASIETNVAYAKFLEYGTSKMMPRQHFRNTAARMREKVIAEIKESVR